MAMIINRNYSNDLRVSQRIKFDQALYILTMYEKKIREKDENLHKNTEINNADECQGRIIQAWKKKWENDLTKPILTCVLSIYPRIISKLPSQAPTHSLANYYAILNTFIQRMKIQHEDETNYKLVLDLSNLSESQMLDNDEFNSKVCKKIIKNTFSTIQKMNNLMRKSWIETSQQVEDSIDYDVDYYRFLKKKFDFISFVVKNYGMDDEQQEGQNKQSLSEFVRKMMIVMDRVKESDHGCTLFGIQPMIDHLTYLVHPVLIAIEGHLLKQIYEINLQKNSAFNLEQLFEEGEKQTLIDAIKYNPGSKVVFINLDGYESEFNIELARNLKKNLLYISFPKQNVSSQIDEHNSRQFYKKLMFHFSETNQSKSNFLNRSHQFNIATSSSLYWQEETFLHDPEHYHHNVKKIYPFNKFQDLNQNIYILPIRSTHLKKQFHDIMGLDSDTESYESHFVRFILRDFLINQIREFTPTFVVISYSGRINIEEGHFVQICQQLTKVATYKLILFPNFTTSQCSDINETDEDGEPLEYSFIKDPRIGFFSKNNKESMVEGNDQINIDFLDRIAQFLKVGSGTFNLTRSFQEQTYLSKYKNQMALQYADEIMEVLSKEYASIDRIKFRNKDLSILPKLYEDKVKQLLSTNSLLQTVPKYYMRLYSYIESLIFRKQINETILQSYYEEDIINIYDLYGIKQQNGIFYGLDDFMKIFNQFREANYIDISGERYADHAYIFLRMQEHLKQNQTEKASDNLDLAGLCSLKFTLHQRDFKSDFKIFESTSILYRSDRNFINDHAKTVPILIMNHLDQKGEQFLNYLAYIYKSDVTNENTKSITTINIPINQSNIINTIPYNNQAKANPFIILSQWNFGQTQRYLILYWPSQYDLIKHALYKLIRKTYQPKILNQMYIYEKSKYPYIFQPVKLSNHNEICPRVGCSAYDLNGKVFIFGGFYEKEKNYLQLQHDITTFDLANWDQTHKVEVGNLKQFLYSPEITQIRVKQGESANSYVRPRMEFEFYEMSELQREDGNEMKTANSEEQTRKVVMFGGYGQNFIRPYSMLTYYYYELTFNNIQRQLNSVQKKIIYGKAIPINTKNISKNLGILKMYKKINGNSNQQQFKEDFTSPDSSALCRFKYFFTGKSFDYSFKYAFSDDQFNVNKQRVRQIFEQKTEGIINTEISISKFEGENQRNNIIFSKDDKKIKVPLAFELPPQIAKKLDKHIAILNHQSVISLSIPWDNYIYAIIQHPMFTEGKCVLAEFSISSLENTIFSPQDITYACLKTVQQFQQNLTMNILQSNNATKIVIFHGERLTNSPNLVQYFIHKKLKPEKVNCFKIEPRLRSINQDWPTTCYSVFFAASAKIRGFEFLEFPESSLTYLSIHDLDINKPEDNKYQWATHNQTKLSLIFSNEEQKNISLSKLKFIKMAIPKDWEESRDKQLSQRIYLWLQFHKQKYIYEFCLEQLIQQTKRAHLSLVCKYSKINFDNYEMSYNVLHKTMDIYTDKGFIQ